MTYWRSTNLSYILLDDIYIIFVFFFFWIFTLILKALYADLSCFRSSEKRKLKRKKWILSNIVRNLMSVFCIFIFRTRLPTGNSASPRNFVMNKNVSYRSRRSFYLPLSICSLLHSSNTKIIIKRNEKNLRWNTTQFKPPVATFYHVCHMHKKKTKRKKTSIRNEIS